MSKVNLPPLSGVVKNTPTSVITTCNRVFAIFALDTWYAPFWVMEIDQCVRHQQPVGAVHRYNSHIDAVRALSALAVNAMGGNVAIPPGLAYPPKLEAA